MTTVVSLGIHIVDILGRPVTRIPDGQNVDLLEEIRITVAGTAAGASVDLAKLGARVIAMGALGKDELGNFVVSTMQHYGIETRYLRRKEGVQTSATMLPIRPNGERPALHVPGANGALTLDDIDFDVIAEADWVIDLGPEGGSGGGQVVIAGTPEQVAACPASYTGRALAPFLAQRRPPA
jgi:sugar/nucleoside kinase (ribokinase family)